MSEERIFTILWSIPEAQWEKAQAEMTSHGQASTYDLRGLGRYYLLYGDVDFVYDQKPLYGSEGGSNGINISLFDLAIALADAYCKKKFIVGGKVRYEQLDDDRQIDFFSEPQDVRITANDQAVALVVPRAAFEQGVLRFLREFAAAINTRIAGALEWESLAPIKEVALRFASN